MKTFINENQREKENDNESKMCCINKSDPKEIQRKKVFTSFDNQILWQITVCNINKPLRQGNSKRFKIRGYTYEVPMFGTDTWVKVSYI